MYSDYPCSDWPNLITMSEMVLANGKIGEAAEIWLVESMSAEDRRSVAAMTEEEGQILVWREEITSVSE
jgi:hypothetical protein